MTADIRTCTIESESLSSDDSTIAASLVEPKTASAASQIDQDNASQDHVGPPPDGGFKAWLQVAVSFIAIFNSWGYLISFGIFQSYYTHSLQMEPSSVSWIGSTQQFLVFFMGIFSGRAFDAGHYMTLMRGGFLLQLIGLYTTSCATKYWQIFLAQGLCQGLGCGLVFAPIVANVGSYFSKKKTLALSTVACGSAVGGLVFPAIAKEMLPRVGFSWTIRIMGLVMVVNYFLVLTLTKTRLPPRKSGPLIEMEAFKEPAYLLFCIGSFFTLWAAFFGYFYARAFNLDRLSGTQADSFSILMIINSMGVPGRLVPAYLADHYFSAINTLVPTILGCAVAIFSWAAVHSIRGHFIWVIFFGYFGSGIQGLLPAVCAGLTSDLSKSGTRIGMVFSIISVACLTGPPLAGKLIEVDGGGYLAAQMWAGSCLTIGAILTLCASWANNRAKGIKTGSCDEVKEQV